MKLWKWEITLKKIKHHRSKNKLGARRWTKSEIDSMLKQYNDGVDILDISKNLNRTKASIYTKMNKVRS